MKAVVLAGGFGKRLKPLTDERPKPMIEILNVPIIEWQVKWLRKFGIKGFALCVGYMREQIIDCIGNGSKYGAAVVYSVEEAPLGTGGALKNAKSLLAGQDSFFMLIGDVLTDLDPNSLRVIDSQAIALIPLRSPYGVVEVGEDSRVTGFVEKPEIPGMWINAGVYHLTQDVFNYLPENGNIEVTALPTLASEGKLKAVKYRSGLWRSIESHKGIEEPTKEMQSLGMS